ncbi:hypothetical protein C1701_19850 [Actinoalloteichus sp. AHMU CJ021]|uniref:DUF4097 domain-containing protein n=1 Tax=Actinoalloteichus caeruleus DSM 43889 TaxID=1120930 RepID=A0ABT1JQI4_ACTCY|nr:DUF4097 family beta strand repeat-containing protein [Actinoalloteichus caeruleus]AUS80212.1 hypothetical protein C1701_19850 [Actinoalloteichus sp. AHMU CJ021]MCP2334439.1 protein of unknown function (DUF4098) [Actinoalloteichus caeruleus DSM 43889]
MTTDSDHDGQARQARYRRVEFEADGPVDLDIGVADCDVTVELGGASGGSAELRHAPDRGAGWAGGLLDIVGWATERAEGDSVDLAAKAIERTRIDHGDNRLLVRSPQSLPLRSVPMSLLVRVPSSSRVTVRTETGDVTVTGEAAGLDLRAGTGEVRADASDGRVDVGSGAGRVRLTRVRGETTVHSGAGEVELTEVSGRTAIRTGLGRVRLGTVRGDVTVRSGAGDITVTEAVEGNLRLTTGTGQLRIGIARGVHTELDVHAPLGGFRSALAVSDRPPSDGEVGLRVRARSGMGRVLVASTGDS